MKLFSIECFFGTPVVSIMPTYIFVALATTQN